MASSIKELIRARRNVLTQLNAALRTVDSEVEKSQRKIKSLKARKLRVPEIKDLEVLAQYGIQIDRALDAYSLKMAAAKTAFNL
jgi:hypothetical protein